MLKEGCFFALEETRADEKELIPPGPSVEVKRDPDAVLRRCLESLPSHADDCILQLSVLSIEIYPPGTFTPITRSARSMRQVSRAIASGNIRCHSDF